MALTIFKVKICVSHIKLVNYAWIFTEIEFIDIELFIYLGLFNILTFMGIIPPKKVMFNSLMSYLYIIYIIAISISEII